MTSMTRSTATTRPPTVRNAAMARYLTIAGLVVAPLGIGVLILYGVEFPPIPPGVVIPLVGAALVAGIRRWWSPALGAAVAAFLLIGLVANGSALGGLSDPGQLAVFTGTALLFLGLIVALVSGIVATVLGLGARR